MLYKKFQSFIKLEEVWTNANKSKYSLWKKLTRKCEEPKKNKYKEFEIFFRTINPNGIHDKVALVIGGSSGVGLDCVHQLISNGAKGVMIADDDEIRGKKLIKRFCQEYGVQKTCFIQTDVDDTVLLRHAYCSTMKHMKGLDIVVNNNRHKQYDNWEQQIDHNIKGVVRNTLIAMEYMGTHNGGKGGVVVNVVSRNNRMKMSQDGIPLFIGTKHFVMGFDRSVAIQYFKLTGVKVLSLCPEESLITDKCGELKYDLVKLLSRANCGRTWS